MALAIFEQQAMALGRLFTIAANFTDPDAYFLGGGVVEAAPHFRRLVPHRRCASTPCCARSRPRRPKFALVPDLDMAGARGSAYAARDWLIAQGQHVKPAALLSPQLAPGAGDDHHHGEAAPASGCAGCSGPGLLLAAARRPSRGSPLCP